MLRKKSQNFKGVGKKLTFFKKNRNKFSNKLALEEILVEKKIPQNVDFSV